MIGYRYPRAETVNYVHRVIALSGDTVSFRNNRVTIDGVEQGVEFVQQAVFIDDRCERSDQREWRESLSGMQHAIYTSSGQVGYLADHDAVVVPEGTVFVAGDNRDHARDSRSFGAVSVENIVGKAMSTWLSWDECGGGRIRTERFMAPVVGGAP